MKRSSRHLPPVCALLGLLLVSGAPVSGGDPRGLGFTCEGSVRYKLRFGETHWSGQTTLEHPLFRLEVDGEVHSFSGPGLRLRSGADAHGPPGKRVTTRTEWISLVAVGDIRVTFRTQAGELRRLPASRVVYLPRERRLLVDGVSHACAEPGPEEGERGSIQVDSVRGESEIQKCKLKGG